ncbi:MAG: hypothetical protein ACRCVG_06865 [Methanobacteriaceae archaeon]
MHKILKITIFVIFFVMFFEMGLLGSYTIVTSEQPNIQNLIDFQVNMVMGFFSSENVDDILTKEPTKINITNKEEVAEALTPLAGVDGVNLNSINTTTYQSPDTNKIMVNITCLAYPKANISSTQIVLSTKPEYKIVATAQGESKSNGIEVIVSTLKITSTLKVYST